MEIFIDSLDHWCCKPSTDLNKSSFFDFRCLKWNPGRNQTAAQLHNRAQKEKKKLFSYSPRSQTYLLRSQVLVCTPRSNGFSPGSNNQTIQHFQSIILLLLSIKCKHVDTDVVQPKYFNTNPSPSHCIVLLFLSALTPAVVSHLIRFLYSL